VAGRGHIASARIPPLLSPHFPLLPSFPPSFPERGPHAPWTPLPAAAPHAAPPLPSSAATVRTPRSACHRTPRARAFPRPTRPWAERSHAPSEPRLPCSRTSLAPRPPTARRALTTPPAVPTRAQRARASTGSSRRRPHHATAPRPGLPLLRTPLATTSPAQPSRTASGPPVHAHARTNTALGTARRDVARPATGRLHASAPGLCSLAPRAALHPSPRTRHACTSCPAAQVLPHRLAACTNACARRPWHTAAACHTQPPQYDAVPHRAPPCSPKHANPAAP